MTIAIVASGSVTRTPHSDGGGTRDYDIYDFTMPTVQAGDLALIVFFGSTNTISSAPSGFTTPVNNSDNGWWARDEANNALPDNTEVFKRVLTGSEGGTDYTWHVSLETISLGSGPPSYSMGGGASPFGNASWVVVRGTDGTTAFDQDNETNSSGTAYYPFDASHTGDAYLGFFWGDGISMSTYPSESQGYLGGSPPNWYRIASITPTTYLATSSISWGPPDDFASPPTIGITLKNFVAHVGAAAGTSTAAGVGASTTRAVGAAAGTSTAAAYAGSFGTAGGTSTATATGTAIVASVGDAAGHSTVLGFNPLRQAVGLAEGTSSTGPDLPQVVAATLGTTLDHADGAINRLCQQFLELP